MIFPFHNDWSVTSVAESDCAVSADTSRVAREMAQIIVNKLLVYCTSAKTTFCMYDIMVRFDDDFATKSRSNRMLTARRCSCRGAPCGSHGAAPAAGHGWRLSGTACHPASPAPRSSRRTTSWNTKRHQLWDRHAERPAETPSVTSSETVTPNDQLKHKASSATLWAIGWNTLNDKVKQTSLVYRNKHWHRA